MANRTGGWRTSFGAVCALGVLALPLASRVAAEPVPGSVVINEIHYHPVTDNQEFVELFNPGETSVDLSGACFTAGISGCFPAATSLPAGGFVVAAQQLAAYQSAFPAAPAPKLIYGGSLSNSGETVTVSAAPVAPDPAVVLDSVGYTDSPPWPATPDGDGPSLELADPLGSNAAADAWRASDPAPTPGAVNSQYGKGPGPTIDSVTPGPVAADEPLTFTAALQHATSASLEVTVGFGASTTTPMVDDGAHGDGAAGDGTYGAAVAGRPAGTLVRYRVLASNASGSAALPAEGSARPRLGLVVARPAVSTTIPVVDWYIKPNDYQALLANPYENTYVPAVVAVGGEVWDGVEVRVNGHVRSSVKYSFKFKMPKASPLTAGFLTAPVDEFVLDGDLADPSGVVAPLTSSIYADTNPLMAQMAKVHVEQNNATFGLFTFAEEYDKLWRQRNGLDDAGDEQYEPEDIIGVLADDGSAADLGDRYEKVQPGDTDFNHLYDLVRIVDSAPTPARMAALRDAFDIPALIEFLAVGAVVQHWDTTVHNYQLLRDGATGRWRFVATDYDNALLFRSSDLFPQGPEVLISALRSDPVLSDLYLRRVRTLSDTYLAGGVLKQRLDTMAAAVAADQAADIVRWPRTLATPAQGRSLVSGYLTYRTKDLLTTHRTTDEVPAAPTAGAPVAIAAARYVGDGGNDRDAVRLHNPSATEAIDLSGWQLEGAGAATLPPGTVIPAGGDITVPTKETASAADRFPGAFVAGALAAGLDDAGGELRLKDAGGTLRAAAVLSALSPVAPAAKAGLSVEASADQVETIAPNGNGVKLTVAVTNHGPASAAGVTLSGPGTTCGRSIGTIGKGHTVVIRCTTTPGSTAPGTSRDRTFRFRATTGSKTVASNRVEVRTLEHHNSYWSTTLPGTPRVGTVQLADGSKLRAPTSLAPLTAPGVADQPPVRWIVASALSANKAIPTQGSVLAPTSTVLVPLAEGVAVRLSLAARNGAGTGSRSPLTPFLTPRSSVNWPFASPTDQVNRIFGDIDGRAPTTSERSWVLAALANGTSPASVIEDRLETGRWPTEVEPLLRLYAAYLGRPPDGPGLRYWIAQRASGRTLNSISASFAGSSEFVRATGSLRNADFVRFVYSSVLGRQPDSSGLAFWTQRLDARASRGEVMTAFSESGEGRSKLAPEVVPTLVWTALLGRPPSAGEAQPAADWLRSGGSIKTVIDGVRSSKAYGDRVS